MSPTEVVRDRLPAIRKVRGLTQGDVAAVFGVHRAVVSQFEARTRKNLTLDEAVALSDLAGIPLGDLIRPVPLALSPEPVVIP